MLKCKFQGSIPEFSNTQLLKSVVFFLKNYHVGQCLLRQTAYGTEISLLKITSAFFSAYYSLINEIDCW